MGYALWRSLSVVVGCLGNGRLPHQWRTTSLVVEYLGNGGHPSLQSWTFPGSAVLAVKLSTQSISNCCFFVGVGPAEPDDLAPCLRAFFF